MSAGGYLGVFALMFLLELPDKTMIATIIMGARSRALPVWLGASSAFVVQMALAVTAGGLLTLLPATAREVVVGLLFLGGGAYLLLRREESEEASGERRARAEDPGSARRVATTAFVVIFLAEFGDLTQVQAATLAARTHDPVGVFVAGSLAMVSVSALGAFGGQALERLVPLKVLRVIGGVVFLTLAGVTLAQAAGA
ncbi:MAG TPA: TMEM165/GDT1 family protein [Acidimicrobiales bacterium]|nr:TMEM165/GDT1 family protein [Acidimicrobiales bacterium]